MKSNRTWADSLAFPCSEEEISPGLSKREYFAALCFQGIIASSRSFPSNAAEVSVAFADQLIEALNKNEES